ncbi:MAG: right-handed parallel beta-helix repeat-containing protein [Desulfuromonadales bacterium]|nr:right-handed parallel beta-helix repeat-containing protein [Desulfuromonadales bacterium]
MRQRNTVFSVLSASALLLALSTTPASAVDGVIEINQARALAGNVTSGDTAGFPVTISQSGSYRLTGNLTVPNTSVHAIQITADNVSVDLNGFSIIGQTVCSGTPLECVPTASGYGIDSLRNNISVANGVIRGMGMGLWLVGDTLVVENVRVLSNSMGGIYLGYNAIVNRSVSRNNGGNGINVFNGTVNGNTSSGNGKDGISVSVKGATVTNNFVSDNEENGIHMTRGVAMGNTAVKNTGFGLLSEGGCVYNMFYDNNGGNSNSQRDCIALGSNVCGAGLCP